MIYLHESIVSAALAYLAFPWETISTDFSKNVPFSFLFFCKITELSISDWMFYIV